MWCYNKTRSSLSALTLCTLSLIYFRIDVYDQCWTNTFISFCVDQCPCPYPFCIVWYTHVLPIIMCILYVHTTYNVSSISKDEQFQVLHQWQISHKLSVYRLYSPLCIQWLNEMRRSRNKREKSKEATTTISNKAIRAVGLFDPDE